MRLAAGIALLALVAVAMLAGSSSKSPIETSSKSLVAAPAAHQQKLWEGMMPTQKLQDEEAPAEEAAATEDAPADDAETAPADDEAAPEEAAAPVPAEPKESAEEKIADEHKKEEKKEGIAADFVPHLDKIRMPSSWDDFRSIFGMHLDWTIFITFLGILVYLYTVYILPRMPKNESEQEEEPEDDSIQPLDCLPGEELFIHKRSATSSSWWELLCCGCGNRVWSLAVTDKRIVAMRREATAFGTCILTDTKEAWPIENVSKVTIIGGEFWGHSVPKLWEMSYKYLLVALLFDFFHAFVKENIKDVLGPAADHDLGLKIIWGVNVFLYILCNILFLLAVIYSFAVMALFIWPHSLIKVYLTRDMHERGHPLADIGGWCGGRSNSDPMESFTFQTKDSEDVFKSIMSARLGLPTPKQ